MRESFVIHTEYIEDLPEENKAEFLLYIYEYGAKGIVPELKGFANTVWLKIQRRIDADIEQYEDTVKARSAAGKKHKGNQYTKQSEQNGTNGTESHSVEQNGTNGTVYVNDIDSVNVNEFDNSHSDLKQEFVCEKKHFNYGKLQKDCWELIQEHNKTAQEGRAIPCSLAFFSFIQSEFTELIRKVGKSESPERIIATLKNFIKIAKSDTWQKTFTWNMFLQHYNDYTPEFFTLKRYLNSEPETDDATQKPEYKFYMRMKDNTRFSIDLFQRHIEDWKTEGRPEGADYFKLQNEWEAQECL